MTRLTGCLAMIHDEGVLEEESEGGRRTGSQATGEPGEVR